ncbi:MAG: EAL domain-containing protein [Betaproteobacteria bacterium]|nr:MAG: EAL domain-containing protein [Betaproteobacteria bacterium]
MAGASGPKGKSAREPSSSSRWRSPRRRPPTKGRSGRRPMDKTSIRVLFVEDSEVDVELALRSLEQDGFEVSWERVDLEEDLKRALGSSKPQAILSDFSMPRFDGVDALRLAKELAPHVPFIFLSGTIGEERAIEAMRLGATDYVLKNNMRRLVTVVRRALSEAGERERIRVAEEERARLVQILEATSDYVCMTDPAGTITYLNAAGRKLIGAPESQGAGKSTGEIYPAWARELIEREGTPVASSTGAWTGETAILGADGTEIPVSQVIIAHRGPGGEIRFFSTIARDIRERKAYEARLQYLANYDPLTGLPNRDLLGDRTLQAVAHARRASRPAALLVLNLDRFKLVNESYSRGAGDALLRMVADRLKSAVREGDTVARLGGDAFAVLATDLARPDDVLSVARKIREAMHSPFRLEARDLHVTLSIGASVTPRDGEEFDMLLRNADAAMHRVKAEGRDGFQFYAAAMTRQAAERVELENELRLALEKNQLEMHYQPQVVLADGRIVGVEALMRWNHAQRGSISPGQFIPVAEDSDLIHPLGAFALAESCRQIRVWGDAGSAELRLAVNVSARQFRSPGFVNTVERALRASGLAPRNLELELTEGVLVESRDRTVAVLKGLKELGVQIAVDDFGMGYSSLSYLSRLPIDCLKIDRTFVSQARRRQDAAIIQTVILLAHSLGVRVIAEGVETVEQLDFLRMHRCDQAQGYFFSPAVHPGAMAQLLAAGSIRPPAGKFN